MIHYIVLIITALKFCCVSHICCLNVCFYTKSVKCVMPECQQTVDYCRDVNSREIAFPGRESQFPGLDRDSILPEYVPPA